MEIVWKCEDRPNFVGTYKIAGHNVRIISLYKTIHDLCKDYACEEDAEFEVEIFTQDILEENVRAQAEDALEGLPVHHYLKMNLETTAAYRKITDKLIDYGIFLFHGSVIAVDGQAYLFTAKSGTGKSTHTRLWREMLGERAVMVNDDKPLLELKNGGVTVYGTPWNGKHNIGTNISVPLKAICVLERGENNCIEQINPSEAYAMVLQQSNRSVAAEKMVKTLELLEETLHRVKIYRLKCNMDPEAAKVAFEGMQ